MQRKEPEAPSTLRGDLARSLFLTAALTLPAQAQLDTSGTGMSDVWERHFNNDQLFDPENPDHHPDADPDRDGWSNYQESIAGTDPFSANPPEGMVAVHFTHVKDPHETPSPEFIGDQAIISWDTLPGKLYTLHVSHDLTPASWTAVNAPLPGDGYPVGYTINLSDTAGIAPDKLFWRVNVEDPHHDSDGDGLTDYEEYLLGSNPYESDTSGDGVPDRWLVIHGYNPNDHHENILFGDSNLTVPDAYNLGVQDHPNATLEDFDGDGVPNELDADPHDYHIDWERTPETRYVWLEQVEHAADIGSPMAVNKHGVILFQTGPPAAPGLWKVLWDSATQQWVDLAPQGNMDAVSLGQPVTVDAPAREVYDLNDDGTVIGSSMQPEFYGSICCTYPGMVWKRSAGVNHTAYQAPYYFFANHPIQAFEQIEHLSSSGLLADDGTYLAEVAFDSWKTHDTVAGGKGMDSLPLTVDASLPWADATILDRDRILIIGNNPSIPNSEAIWLIEGQEITLVTSDVGSSQYASLLVLNLAPSQTGSEEERLWLSAMGSVHLEVRDGGTGTSRWHTPASMNEGASFLHPEGYALTLGGYNHPTQSTLQPRLWRNAQYTDINELTEKPEGVTITQVIDLASNGIILATAMDDGMAKTGLLLPLEFRDYYGGDHFAERADPKCCDQKVAQGMLSHRYPENGSDRSVYIQNNDTFDISVRIPAFGNLQYEMVYELLGMEILRKEISGSNELQVVKFDPNIEDMDPWKVVLGAHGFEMQAFLVISDGESEIINSPPYKFMVDNAILRNAEFKTMVTPLIPGTKSKGSYSEVLMGLMLYEVSKEIVNVVEKNTRDHTVDPELKLNDPSATQGTNRLIIRSLGEQMGVADSDWDKVATEALDLEAGVGVKSWKLIDVIFNQVFPKFEVIENQVRGEGWETYGCPCGNDNAVLKAASLRGVSSENIDAFLASYTPAGTLGLGILPPYVLDRIKDHIKTKKLPDLERNFQESWDIGGCCN